MIAAVGFIGLGEMGFPMAMHLTDAATRVVVHDIDQDRSRRAATRNKIEAVDLPNAVARATDVTFTCLPTPESVRQVYLGEEGLAAGAHHELLTCDCSTMPEDVVTEVHAAMRARGVSHMDAPIFGTPQHARNGDVYFAVSGDETQMPRLKPFFDAMGRGYRRVGAAGTAHRLKLIQNGLSNGYAVMTAEVLVLAALEGIDLETFVEVVQEARALSWSVYIDRYAKAAATGTDSGGGRLAIGAKDSAMLLELARAHKLEAPILRETARVFEAALGAGLAKEEFTAVSRVIEQRLGRKFFGVR